MYKKNKKGTYKHHLFIQLKEGHNSFRQSTKSLNALFYVVHELQPVGLTEVYNAINLCNYEKNRTQKTMQTNLNNLVYKQARHNWLAQLLVRMGATLPENDESECC